MTCRQLAGACDVEFHANTFEGMATMSQNHGRDMFKKQDAPHLAAMEAMMKFTPQEMQTWMDQKKNEFDSLPEDK